MQSGSLGSRVMSRITRKCGDVFLRADFKDLGGYNLVGCALRGSVRRKISYDGSFLTLEQGVKQFKRKLEEA